MRIESLVLISEVLAVITVIINIVSIVLALLKSRKYFYANRGIKNVDFPSSDGFSNKDFLIDEQFCEKFRGSVRLGRLNIFTDEQIEEKRKKANIPLP